MFLTPEFDLEQAPKRKAAPAPKPKPLPVGDTAEAASSRSSARAAASVAEKFASFVPPRLQVRLRVNFLSK